MLAQLGRVDVLGTDIDRQCLDAAALGEFEEGDFAETPPELRQRYFTASAPFTVVDGDSRHRPLPVARPAQRGSRPPGAFDLIACRNVLIYFDRETQERLFESFYHALAPGRLSRARKSRDDSRAVPIALRAGRRARVGSFGGYERRAQARFA